MSSFLTASHVTKALWLFLLPALTGVGMAASQAAPTCDRPVLSQLIRHKIARGETVDSIARRYNLIPATLLGMNPVLRSGTVPVGREIVVPPYNGIRVNVPAGQTLREVAATYKVRADVLFEVNGCQTAPKVVFVPGVNWSPNTPTQNSTPAVNPTVVLTGYPLAQRAKTVMGYGWQLQPTTNKVAFHSGVDLAAQPGTPVLAVADGTIAFAGKRGAYGNLVVINHRQGWQTRYGQLAVLKVKTGQTVKRGATIGLAGKTGTPSSTEAHLHFEIRSNSSLGWVAEDPEQILKSPQTARGN